MRSIRGSLPVVAALLLAAWCSSYVVAGEGRYSWQSEIESANWFERRMAVRSIGDSRPLDAEAIPFLYWKEKGQLGTLFRALLKEINPAMREALFSCKDDPDPGKRLAVAEVLFEIAPYSDREIDDLVRWLDDDNRPVLANVLMCFERSVPVDRVRSKLINKLTTSDEWLSSRIGRLLEQGERK